MITGQRPFSGDSHASIVSAILRDSPPSITERNPALPHSLARIVKRCLAKDPTRRYQTALDLRNELEEVRQELDSGVGVGAATRPPIARLPIAAVAFIGVGAVIAGLFHWFQRPQATSPLNRWAMRHSVN